MWFLFECGLMVRIGDTEPSFFFNPSPCRKFYLFLEYDLAWLRSCERSFGLTGRVNLFFQRLPLPGLRLSSSSAFILRSNLDAYLYMCFW